MIKIIGMNNWVQVSSVMNNVAARFAATITEHAETLMFYILSADQKHTITSRMLIFISSLAEDKSLFKTYNSHFKAQHKTTC